MPVSEGGGWVAATGTDSGVPSVLTGVGPDKPAAGPPPAVSAEALRGGFDWGADSKIRPGMSDAEKTAAIAAARRLGGVPSRFRAPPTVADLPRGRDPLDDVDGLLDRFDDDSLPSDEGQVEADTTGVASPAVAAARAPVVLAPTAPVLAPSQAVQAGPDPVTPSGGPAPAPASGPAPSELSAAIVALYVQERLSPPEIRSRLGCGKATVYRALRHADVELRPPAPAPMSTRHHGIAADVPPEVIAKVRELYGQGWSQRRIAVEVGHHQTWVSTLMVREGMARRPAGRHRSTGSHSPPPQPVDPLERIQAAVIAEPWQELYDRVTSISGEFGLLADLIQQLAGRAGIEVST